MTGTTAIRSNPMEDAIAQLPKATSVEYRRGQVIYTGAQPSHRVYFLLDGQVAVSRLGSEGSPVVVGIYQKHDIFGEAALVNQNSRFEQAIALENCLLMSWPANEIVEAVVKQPQLGMAIAKHLVERESELRWRIESF